MHRPGAALSAVLSAVLRLPRCGNLSCPWRCPERSCDALLHSVLEDCMLIASLIDSLHSVLEVIVEPGALERSHLREVINEGGNQQAISMQSMLSRRSDARTSSASSSSKSPPLSSFLGTVGEAPEEEPTCAHDGAIGSGPPANPTSRSPPSAHDGANSCVRVR